MLNFDAEGRLDSVLYFTRTQIIQRQRCHHIETSQLICRTNQLTGFYMMATLAFNNLTYRDCHYAPYFMFI